MIPADLMDNCNQWKITYPTGEEDKTLCDEPNNEFFYVNETGDALVFYAPIRSDNGTTPNSDNIRSELRERESDGSVDIYWTTEGAHMLYVKQAITHLPINKSHLVASQIHGDKEAGIDDAMVLRLENKHLFLCFNGGDLRDDITIKTDYELGTLHEVIFLVVDNKHYCFYAEDGNLLNAYNSGDATAYLVKEGDNDFVMDLAYDQSYFKVGNYTQSNADEEGDDTDDPDNYGAVLVYDFLVDHEPAAISEVSLSPNAVSVLVHSTLQLFTTVSPFNASTINIRYSSQNPLIASVDSITGFVTALSEGTTTLIAKTEEGSISDECSITVNAAAIGENLALNKPITESGVHDSDYVPANLVDGLTTTKWSVPLYPQTALIDLGEVYTLGRTELIAYKDRDYQYTIEVSETAEGDYTQIVDRSENTTPGTIEAPITDIFSEIEGRFIKIIVTGAATYTGGWMSLLEFRAFAPTPSAIESTTALDKAVLLWPNPVSNTLNIKGASSFQTLTVYNQLGTIIRSQAIQGELVDVSDLKPGLYVFQLAGKDQTLNKYLIKK
jgi:hypothetical protein